MGRQAGQHAGCRLRQNPTGETIMAWAGKILRVNLTKGTVTSEPLNREWARDYVGSRGLGSK